MVLMLQHVAASAVTITGTPPAATGYGWTVTTTVTPTTITTGSDKLIN